MMSRNAGSLNVAGQPMGLHCIDQDPVCEFNFGWARPIHWHEKMCQLGLQPNISLNCTWEGLGSDSGPGVLASLGPSGMVFVPR